MGKFACHCGYVISDSISPCPDVGDLKWQTEFEEQDRAATESIKGLLTSVENGTEGSWIRDYFDVRKYPPIDLASKISDIFTKEMGNKGHCVYQCPECERIYIQKEYFSNEWTCYEKRPS